MISTPVKSVFLDPTNENYYATNRPLNLFLHFPKHTSDPFIPGATTGNGNKLIQGDPNIARRGTSMFSSCFRYKMYEALAEDLLDL